jgi:CubicO group peptidase (beta-lactamase class C family)
MAMKQFHRLAAVLVALLLAVYACAGNQAAASRTSSPSATATTLAARIDAAVRAQAALPVARAFSGTVLVSQGGKIIIDKGYGLADRAHHVPNTPNTTFQIASIARSDLHLHPGLSGILAPHHHPHAADPHLGHRSRG